MNLLSSTVWHAMVDATEPKVHKAFLAAVADIRSAVQMKIVVKAIKDNRIEDAIRAAGAGPGFWGPLDEILRISYLTGGKTLMASLPVIPDPAGLGKWWSALGAGTPERNSGPRSTLAS